MSDKIQQARRAAFEAYVLQEHGNQALNKDGDYFCDITHGAWLGFNAALDCVLIELPPIDMKGFGSADSEMGASLEQYEAASYNFALNDCRAAIESTNLGIKVK